MYADMDEWTEIRKRVLLGGESKRAILRETGMHCVNLRSKPASDLRMKTSHL